MADTENMTQADLDHHGDQLNKNTGTPGINDARRAVEANQQRQKAKSGTKPK